MEYYKLFKPFLSKDVARRQLCGISVKPLNNELDQLELCATDGHVLLRLRVSREDFEVFFVEEHGMALPSIPEGGSILWHDKKVRNGRKLWEHDNPYPEPYVKYENVIPSDSALIPTRETKCFIHFDANNLKKIADACKILGEGTDMLTHTCGTSIGACVRKLQLHDGEILIMPKREVQND